MGEVDDEFFERSASWQDRYLQELEDIVREEVTQLVGSAGQGFLMPMPYSPTTKITSRVKSLDTLASKLKRLNTSIAEIDDVAGARVKVEVDLGNQSVLASALRDRLTAEPGVSVRIRDLRTSGSAGYRAVHLSVRSPAGRAEIQLRTTVQDAWANVFEKLADVAGREIRYGSPPPLDLVPLYDAVQDIASELSEFEQGRAEALSMSRLALDNALMSDTTDFQFISDERKSSTEMQAKLHKEATERVRSLEDVERSIEALIERRRP